MCELLGLSFNLETTPSLSFRGFRKRGKKNPNGWGLAFYPDNSAQIIKEPLTSSSSMLSKFLSDYDVVISKIIIGHVRRSSHGITTHRNTHPFDRELDGKHYVFAHNGTLHSYRELGTLEHFKPLGETNSEYSFCYLRNRFISDQRLSQNNLDFDWLLQKLKVINEKGTFNCIFSDGNYLFCYHDKAGHNGLYYLRREPPFGSVRLKDDDWEVNLSETKQHNQHGYVIATQPLTNEHWHNFEQGELIIFQNGRIIYSSRRSQPFNRLNEEAIQILRTIRTSKHRVSNLEIAQTLGITNIEVSKHIFILLEQGYIKQDSRDTVTWDDKTATFYSKRSKRDEIDIVIE